MDRPPQTPPAYPPLADRDLLLAELEQLIGAAWESFDRPRPEEPGLDADLEARRFTPAFADLMRFEVARTHGYFDRGEKLLPLARKGDTAAWVTHIKKLKRRFPLQYRQVGFAGCEALPRPSCPWLAVLPSLEVVHECVVRSLREGATEPDALPAGGRAG